MPAIMTDRPPHAVGADEEPEPQHERDTGNPDQMPAPPQRQPGRTLRAGLVEDLEDEDNRRGYEDEPNAQLGAVLRRTATERVGGWRAPRTAQEYRRHLTLTPVRHTCGGRA